MFNQAGLDALVAAARAAQRNDALIAAVRSIYRSADGAIAARRPVCWQSGRCCQFDRMQHNLFVSTAELACFLRTADLRRIADTAIEGSCPFLKRDPARCTARRDRPLGCRMFYCDPAAQWWQQQLYNQLHGRLQRVHERFEVPYFYAEWLAVLRTAVRSAGLDTGQAR